MLFIPMSRLWYPRESDFLCAVMESTGMDYNKLYFFSDDSSESQFSDLSYTEYKEFSRDHSEERLTDVEGRRSPGKRRYEVEPSEKALQESLPKIPKVPEEVWSKMTKTRRKNYIRKFKKDNLNDADKAFLTEILGPLDSSFTNYFPEQTSSRNLKVDGCRIAVVKEDYPESTLSNEDANAFMTHLLNIIHKRSRSRPISYGGHITVDGVLIINCKDSSSISWLASTVTSCSPWNGARLKTCHPAEVEKFRKISVFLPAPVRGLEKSLKLIQNQNPGITSKRWRILGRKVYPNGQFFVASIPEIHFTFIKNQGYQIYHGFDTVAVRHRQFDKKSKKSESASKGHWVKYTASTSGRSFRPCSPTDPGRRPLSDDEDDAIMRHRPRLPSKPRTWAETDLPHSFRD